MLYIVTDPSLIIEDVDMWDHLCDKEIDPVKKYLDVDFFVCSPEFKMNRQYMMSAEDDVILNETFETSSDMVCIASFQGRFQSVDFTNHFENNTFVSPYIGVFEASEPPFLNVTFIKHHGHMNFAAHDAKTDIVVQSFLRT